MTGNLWLLLAAGGAVVAVFVALSLLADNYNLKCSSVSLMIAGSKANVNK